MKTYWESENSSLVLAAIVLWLRLYHLQNKCISEPTRKSWTDVHSFLFQRNRNQRKSRMHDYQGIAGDGNIFTNEKYINLIVSNLTISKLSLIYLTIWKQSSIYLTISKPASEKFPRAPASKIWSRSLSSFIEIWRKKGFGESAVKVIHMIMNMANDGVLSMKLAIKHTPTWLKIIEMVHNFLYS